MFYVILQDTHKKTQVACMCDRFETLKGLHSYLFKYETDEIMRTGRYRLLYISASLPQNTKSFYPSEL